MTYGMPIFLEEYLPAIVKAGIALDKKLDEFEKG